MLSCHLINPLRASKHSHFCGAFTKSNVQLVKEEQARRSEGSLELRDSGDVEKARLLSERGTEEEDGSAVEVEASVGSGNTNVAESSTSPRSEKVRGKNEREAFALS